MTTHVNYTKRTITILLEDDIVDSIRTDPHERKEWAITLGNLVIRRLLGDPADRQITIKGRITDAI